MALKEANELLECFQWSDNDYDIESVKEELADVMNYCIQMSQVLNVDIIEIINNKMDKTEAKYPVEKAKGEKSIVVFSAIVSFVALIVAVIALFK